MVPIATSLAESALVTCVHFKGSGAFCVLIGAKFQSSNSMTSRIIIQKNRKSFLWLSVHDPSICVHLDVYQCAPICEVPIPLHILAWATFRVHFLQ